LGGCVAFFFLIKNSNTESDRKQGILFFLFPKVSCSGEAETDGEKEVAGPVQWAGRNKEGKRKRMVIQIKRIGYTKLARRYCFSHKEPTRIAVMDVREERAWINSFRCMIGTSL
jgi:hypothetical protein